MSGDRSTDRLTSSEHASHQTLRVAHYLRRVRAEDGGVVTAVRDLAALTAEAGHEVSLITFDPRDCPQEWLDSTDRASVPAVYRLEKLSDRSAQRALRETIERSDIVHLHSVWGPDDAYIARMARRLGKPYAVSLHGVLDGWSLSQGRLKKRIYLSTIARTLLQRAAFVHCTAEEELRQARLSIAIEKPAVIRYVIDLSPFVRASKLYRNEARDLNELRRILFISRIHRKKGLHHLIHALAILRARGLNLRLDIAGDGEPEYRQFVNAEILRLSLERHTRFLGHVREPARSQLLAESDVMVLPTSQENFGLVLVESLASGTPVVTTTGVDIHADLARTGAAFILNVSTLDAPESAAEALADAIERALAQVNNDQDLMKQAQLVIDEWLDPHRTAAAYIAAYSSASRRRVS